MSTHSKPIVPHVLYVAEQHHPWRLAAYERLVTRYHTPTTVATEFGTIDMTVKPIKGKTGVSKQQTHVYCLADENAWEHVQMQRAELQRRLDDLAAGLRSLGGYAKRLEEAGGFKQAPNPLSGTVISADDPDTKGLGYFVHDPVPRLARSPITSHTPKMLRGPWSGNPTIDTTFHQRDHFVCPDDAAWERIQALVAAVQRAADAWKKLLHELGTYHSALADKRYARKEAPAMPKQIRSPLTTEPPAVPDDLAQWRWVAHPTSGEWSLLAPDQAYNTKWYLINLDRAIEEARRYVLSQPRPKPIEQQPSVEAIERAGRNGPPSDDAIAAAAAMLRARNMTVRPHGFKWLIRQTGTDSQRVLTLSPDDLVLAAGLAHQAVSGITIDQLADQLYAETGETPPGAAADTVPPGGWGYHTLPIEQIRRDGGTQARVGLNEDTVQEYAESMRDGRWDWSNASTPWRPRPIVCWDADGYWLADGFHRIEAAQRAGRKDYPVEVLRGGKRAAVLRAAGANAEHGLRRTNADKRRAVELLLKDEEWRQWSDRKIAEACAVSNRFVSDIRGELSVNGTQMPTTRIVERNGTTYEMTPAPRPAAPTERRCGRCNKPHPHMTGYGEGIIAEYPNGVVLCHPCIVELLQKQRGEQAAAAAPAAPTCEDCGAPSTSKRAIGGVIANRCDACAIKAAEQERADRAEATQTDGSLAVLTALCERAERLGAQINYLATNSPAMVEVVPPPGYQQTPLPCNADELLHLVERWEAHAAAPASAAPIEPTDWHDDAREIAYEIDLLAMNALRTAREYAAVLMRGLNAVMPLIQTESLEDLSAAISDLNECEEGTEGKHWIAVGYALLDLEPVESEAVA